MMLARCVTGVNKCKFKIAIGARTTAVAVYLLIQKEKEGETEGNPQERGF